MSQPPPSSSREELETRTLTEEANAIKSALTSKPNDKVTPKSVSLNFTSLAASVIPGNNLRKRLGLQMNVEYIPDTFYIMEICQIIFTSSKKDKTISKNQSINIHSFTLYLAHTLMYVYLQVVSLVNPPQLDLLRVLNMYSSAGFDKNKLPSVCSHWLSGLGKYTDPDTKKVFLPMLPDIEAGAVSNSGFFNANTGHLIPNTYCLAAITRLSADRSTGLQILAAAATQTMSGIFGTTHATNGLTNSTLCRSNALRVPGAKALGKMSTDAELISLVDVALTTTFADPLQNLLKVTPTLLAHLKRSQEELFLQIDTITLDPINPIGTSLCMIPLIFRTPQAIQIAARDVEAAVGPPAVPAIFHVPEYDHNSRISTRNEIINGHVDYAYQTPIIRIVNHNDAIVVQDHIFVDPQSPWYLSELEFDTQSATLNDTRAQFGRLP